MSTSASSIQGLGSGIQWQDLITQIMSAESSRRLDPVTTLAATKRQQMAAWSAYRDKANALAAAAKKLKDGSAFDSMTVSGGTSPSTSRTLFNATATTASAAGNYQVEVLGVAQAEKLGSSLFASGTSAMNLAGDFLVNGTAITVAATDSLSAIRDKINAANTGTTPTGVAATLVAGSGGSQRLVLTSGSTGAAGIQLVDGTSNTLQALGILDATMSAATTANGGSETNRFSDAASTLASQLGTTVPGPTTFTVAGQTINVDFNTDTLASLATKLNAVGIQASVASETAGTRTYAKLEVAGQVVADSNDPASARALALLGFARGGRAAAAQVLKSGAVMTDAASSATASGTTLLTNLRTPGAAGLVVGSAVQVRGTKGDGTAVSLDYTVTANSTLDDLVSFINAGQSGTDGFDSGSRRATATLSGGQIVLSDRQGGASELAMSLTSSVPGALDFGATAVQTAGMQREIVNGTDARVRIDGTVITSSINSIANAVPGVTFSLVRAEQGTVVDLAITQDAAGIASAVKDFATAFNDTLTFVRGQTADGQPLAGNASLRASMSSFTNTMLTQVTGLSGTSYTRAAIAGLSLTKTGTLQVDDAALKSALTTNYDDVRKLFSEKGTASDGEVTYLLANAKTQPGTYAVNVTTMPTSASATGSVLAGGAYADDATPDSIRISDTMSGKSVDVALANGDSTDDLVNKLNAGFRSSGVHVNASNAGGALKLDATDVGTGAKFTIAYTGGGSDGSAQLGIAAGTYVGTDIQGTIGGVAATGNGQVLTGAAGSAVEGLAVSYSGNTARMAGTINYVLGVGGMMARNADQVVEPGDGLIDIQNSTLGAAADLLDKRADDIQKRLDLRQAAMTAQFTAMEAALSKIQSQQSWLTGQINSLNSQLR